MLNLEEWDHTVWHAAHQLSFDALEDIRVELRAQLDRICLNFYSIRHVFKIDEIEDFSRLFICELRCLKKVAHLVETRFSDDDLPA